MPAGSGPFEYEDAGAEHDGHIRDIEDSREEQAIANTEYGCSDGKWPVCTETQEGARILDVLKTKRVGEE